MLTPSFFFIRPIHPKGILEDRALVSNSVLATTSKALVTSSVALVSTSVRALVSEALLLGLSAAECQLASSLLLERVGKRGAQTEAAPWSLRFVRSSVKPDTLPLIGPRDQNVLNNLYT